MALATLSIDLEARLAKLQAGLDQAGRLSEKTAAKMQASFDRLQSSAEALGVAVGGIFTVAGAVQFIRANADAVDALNDVSDATGSTIENISALESVALRTGDNLDLVNDVLIKFNGVLKDADGKNAVSQALEAIGLNAKELRQLDPAEALRQTAVALSQYADDGNKARLIQELFGKSAKEAAHFLHDLADSGQLVATMTSEGAAKAEAFNKALATFSANTQQASRALALDFLPILTDFMRQLTAGREAFGSWSGALFSLGTENTDGPLTQLQKYQAKIQETQDAIARSQADGGPMADKFKEQSEKLIAKYQQYVTYYSKLLGLTDKAGAGRGTINPGQGEQSAPDVAGLGTTNTPKLPKLKAEKGDFVGPAIPESYTAALRALEQTDTAKIAALRDELQYLVNLKASGDNRLGIDEAIQNLEQSLADLDPAAKHLQDINAAVDQLLGGNAEQISKINEMLSVLQERFQSGALGVDQFGAATQQLYQQLDQLSPSLKKTADEMSSFWDQAQRNIQNSTSGFLVKAMKGDFKGIEKSFMDMIDNMVAESLGAKFNDWLFGTGSGGSMGGSGSGGGLGGLVSQGLGWVSSLFGGMSTNSAANVASAIGGNDVLGSFLSLTGLGLANGGPAQAGGIHPVVERNQPEMLNIGSDSYLLMPQKAGFVTPLQPARSSRADVRGGTLNLTQNITTPPGTSRASQEQMGLRAYSASARAFSRKG